MPAAWVSAAAAVYGAFSSANASSNANDAQQAATQQSNATQKYMYDQTRADNLPALSARNAALGRLQDLLGLSSNKTAAGYGSLAGPITVGDVTKDPGYQFGLNQGLQALNSQAAARGMRNSGAALLGADRYATDYAAGHYNDAFNREVANRNAVLNPLQVSAGLAQSGANSIAAAGQNYANTVGANQIGAGNAAAANALAQSNAWTNGINQLAGWYGSQQRNNNGYTYGGSAESNQPDNIDAGGGWNPSDSRLKDNIVHIGYSPRGYKAYSWTWKHNGEPSRGVIAQEVAAVDPSAVKADARGFLMVDYSKV